MSTDNSKNLKMINSNRIFFVVMLLVSFIAVNLITHFVGFIHISGESMYPTCKNGEILIYSRRTSDIHIGDIVIFKNKNTNGNLFIKRVFATAGDNIRISGTAYFRNGYRVLEKGLNNFDTEYDLDLTLKDNELFVLGDNRDESYDSRAFGAISVNDVVGVIRA